MKTAKQIARKHGFVNGFSIHSRTDLIEKSFYAAMEEYADQFKNLPESKTESFITPVSGSVCGHDFKPCDHPAISEFDKCTKCGKIR